MLQESYCNILQHTAGTQNPQLTGTNIFTLLCSKDLVVQIYCTTRSFGSNRSCIYLYKYIGTLYIFVQIYFGSNRSCIYLYKCTDLVYIYTNIFDVQIYCTTRSFGSNRSCCTNIFWELICLIRKIKLFDPLYRAHFTLKIHSSTRQITATRCNTLQHTATHCSIRTHQQPKTRQCAQQYTATHCNTRQLTATYCHELQRATTRCNILQHANTWAVKNSSACATIHGKSLQYTAI